MPKLRHKNPMGQVDVPILRRQGEPFGEAGVGCLEPGEVFEAPAEIAGRAPTGTPSSGEPGEPGYVPASEDYDPGWGLLAQVDNYELVKPTRAPAKKAAKKAAPKKAAAPAVAVPTENKEV